MELSIIIVSYNTKDLTNICLSSLISNYKEKLLKEQIEIIIVDNASTDGSIEVIKNIQIRGIILIENKENVGFSRACNLGVQKSQSRNLLFLNSDTQVRDTSLLQMVTYLDKHTHISILGGKLTDGAGNEEKTTGKFLTLPNVALLLILGERFKLFQPNPRQIRSVGWVSGGCMMVKKDVFTKLQGFDEKLFMYVEDMEFCFRVTKMGYKIFFYPYINIVHKGQGSSTKAFAIIQIYKGLQHFYKIHKNSLQYSILKLLLNIKARVAICFGYIMHNSYLVDTYKKALQTIV